MKADAQIQTEKGEPVYVLRASNPFSGMVLRFMANAAVALSIPSLEVNKIRATASAMDAWRERLDRGKTP
jgi:hypothetical protein